MKTARKWFEKLRPDLRDRAIEATKKYPAVPGASLNTKYPSMSEALWNSFSFLKESLPLDGYCLSTYIFWQNIYQEAIDIEQGRKPDIKPKK